MKKIERLRRAFEGEIPLARYETSEGAVLVGKAKIVALKDEAIIRLKEDMGLCVKAC